MYCDAHGYQPQRPQQSLETITKHFQGMGLGGTNSLGGYCDCVILGKSVEQIKDEALIDHLPKIALPNESLQHFNKRRMTFLEGRKIGIFYYSQGECQRLPPVTAISTRLTQANNTSGRSHCHYSKTSKLLLVNNDFETLTYAIYTILKKHVNIVNDILCSLFDSKLY